MTRDYIIPALVALAVFLVAVFIGTFARAHTAVSGEWAYPISCCWGPSANRKGDCDQIPFQSVHVGAAGFEITLAALICMGLVQRDWHLYRVIRRLEDGITIMDQPTRPKTKPKPKASQPKKIRYSGFDPYQAAQFR